MLRRLNSSQAFSLVELLVIVVIIGLLAVVTLPSLLGQKDKAKGADALIRARTAFAVAKSEASSNEGRFPTATGTGGLASKIQSAEPNIGVVRANLGTAVPAAASLLTGDLYIASNGTSSLEIAVKSTSGTVARIIVDGAGKQTVVKP